MSYLPLRGVRILDLTRLIPGDLATRKLADLGADVAKVEDPGMGDYLRLLPPRFGAVGVHHWNLNRGKRSIELDLSSEAGRKTFHRLAAVADAILEVSMPGRYAALGIDFAELRRIHPALVICSISGFGQTGPLADLPAHGMNMDALAGCLLTTRRGDQTTINLELSTSIANELGAVNAALAVTAAIFHAKNTGVGEWIDISCWDAAVEIQRSALARLTVGADLKADDMSQSVLYALYRTRDGREILLCTIELKFWNRFCAGVNRPDLVARWRGPTGGVDHRTGDEELRQELTDIFRGDDGDVWFKRFLQWRIPACILMDGQMIAGSEHLKERQLLRPTSSNTLPEIADPIRWMSDGSRPGQYAATSAEVGQHTEEILRDWLAS